MVNDPQAPFHQARGSLAFALDLLQIEGRDNRYMHRDIILGSA
jgi:hypothetical protein